MSTPRSKLVCLQATNFYHCVSRCVRRAFLCGEDYVTKKNFDHRRDWIEKRIHFLASVFCIDVCAYAVMSNHCHVVLRINKNKIKTLSDIAIAKRWLKLCKGSLLVQQFVKDGGVENHLLGSLNDTLGIYRNRLTDLSWFMRMLNEPIARMANEEDECTGRFWEGRFHSQALLDEAAIAACMVYVDLNPLRAGVAKTPENSDFTSVKHRINVTKNKLKLKTLLPFKNEAMAHESDNLPFKFDEYLNLLDFTGRAIHHAKPGYIESNLPNIISRLSIPLDGWLMLTTRFESVFPGIVGNSESLKKLVEINVRKRRSHLTKTKAILG